MEKIRKISTAVVSIAAALAVLYGGYAFIASRHHDLNSVQVNPESRAKVVDVTADMMDEMLSNWIPNDLLLPRVVVDDVPNYQLGVLEIVRHNTRVFRDNLSRMRTTDEIDRDLELSFKLFANDEFKWVLPSAESKFDDGVDSLRNYSARVDSGSANFYPRADNLVQLVDQYISALGGINTRLINSKGGPSLTYETEGDASVTGEKVINTQVSWLEIDDNLFYARGAAFALLHSMKAVRSDFEVVLKDKNSLELCDKIIEILGRCDLDPMVVFNADYDSIFANHSTTMAALLQDARAKMSSLVRALKDG